MATANLGRVAIVPQGAWSAGTYEYLDLVSNTGGSFLCTAPTTTEEPSEGASDWQVSALDSTAEVVDDTTPQLGGTLDTNAHMIQLSKGVDVASASALPILEDGNYFDVAGTTTVTSINTTGKVGTVIKLHFDGMLTLTHDGTNIILPSGVNVTTAAGDEAAFIEYASGDFICTNYSKADGTALVTNLVDDTTPQLGGDLDTNGKTFNGSSYRQITDASLGTGTHTFNKANGDFQKLTATGNITLAVSGFVSGKYDIFEFELVNGGDHTITFNASWKFDSGAVPTLTSGGTDVLQIAKDSSDSYTLFVKALAVGTV